MAFIFPSLSFMQLYLVQSGSAAAAIHWPGVSAALWPQQALVLAVVPGCTAGQGCIVQLPTPPLFWVR